MPMDFFFPTFQLSVCGRDLANISNISTTVLFHSNKSISNQDVSIEFKNVFVQCHMQ